VAAFLRRRALMLSAAGALACSRSERTAQGGSRGPLDASQVRIMQWDLGMQPWGDGRASIVVPTWGGPTARYPILVALHGRGEALKSPSEGALGWPRDYALLRAFDRLRAPPLTDADYEGIRRSRPHGRGQRLAGGARRSEGLIVACPWLPDLSAKRESDVAAYARFVLDVLLPRVRRETPAYIASEATGIDGVSLGGAVALRIGLTFSQNRSAPSGAFSRL
jgi:hypothetical protein